MNSFQKIRSVSQLSNAASIALAFLASASFVIAADAPRILADKEFFTKGSFIAYAGPWSVDIPNGNKLKQCIDFAMK